MQAEQDELKEKMLREQEQDAKRVQRNERLKQRLAKYGEKKMLKE